MSAILKSVYDSLSLVDKNNVNIRSIYNDMTKKTSDIKSILLFNPLN